MGPKGDKNEGRGARYHARNHATAEADSVWAFEEVRTSLMPTQMILVRVLIAKIENTDKLAQLLRQVPVKQGQQDWNCVSWVKEALSQLEVSTDILGTSVVQWEAVRNTAMSYCQKKRDQRRFDSAAKYDNTRVPTFDLIQGKETIE